MPQAKNIASVPCIANGHRNKKHVTPVLLRMSTPHVKALDDLCKINNRSRRVIIETLLNEVWLEVQQDPTARINPV